MLKLITKIQFKRWTIALLLVSLVAAVALLYRPARADSVTSNITIASYNIMNLSAEEECKKYAAGSRWPNRVDTVAKWIINNNIDVIGLQEYMQYSRGRQNEKDEWYTICEGFGEYSAYDLLDTLNKPPYSSNKYAGHTAAKTKNTIIYDSTKVAIVSRQWVKYQKPAGSDCPADLGAEVNKFQTISTKQEFYVVDVHPCAFSQSVRNQSAKNLAGAFGADTDVKSLIDGITDYDSEIPLILVGDTNSNAMNANGTSNGEIWDTTLNSAGYKDVRFMFDEPSITNSEPNPNYDYITHINPTGTTPNLVLATGSSAQINNTWKTTNFSKAARYAAAIDKIYLKPGANATTSATPTFYKTTTLAASSPGSDHVPIYAKFSLTTTEVAPIINAVNPNSLPLSGGEITIYGAHFGPSGNGVDLVTTVLVGGLPCTSVKVINNSKITCKAPAHIGGTFSVSVTPPSGLTATKVNAVSYCACN
jgi:endonuclease/exonuclease/phosphatase family metal-dependent hydrolase